MTNLDETHWCIGFKRDWDLSSERETRATLLSRASGDICVWMCIGVTVHKPHVASEGLG